MRVERRRSARDGVDGNRSVTGVRVKRMGRGQSEKAEVALKPGLKPLTGFRLKAELRQRGWVR